MAAERAGIPALAVMTEEFIGAAELMAEVLGARDYPFMVIDHPMSSAADDELAVQAERTARRCVQWLVSGTPAATERHR